MSLTYHEIELKYRANTIDLNKFIEFIGSNFEIKDTYVREGIDHFFEKDDTGFLRYRTTFQGSSDCELTIKKKLNLNNNWSRIEVDLPLVKRFTNLEMVIKFADTIGYAYKFSITKYNYIAKAKDLCLSYYTVNEKDHYIEIEVDKKSSLTEEKAMVLLREVEKKLEPLGITHNNRTKKSLFEIYRDKQ